MEIHYPDTYFAGKHIIFYDGNCGLCHRTVQFVLHHDQKDQFFFSALQSEFAKQKLIHYQKDPTTLDTVYVLANVETEKENLLSRSQAAFFIFEELGGIFTLTKMVSWLPTVWLDWAYQKIANARYRLFGEHRHCEIVDVEKKKKFLTE